MSAGAARTPLVESGLPTESLRIIWDLSDIDGDGSLDLAEFTVAMHLCQACKSGDALPESLPAELVPPDKRHFLGL